MLIGFVILLVVTGLIMLTGVIFLGGFVTQLTLNGRAEEIRVSNVRLQWRACSSITKYLGNRRPQARALQP